MQMTLEELCPEICPKPSVTVSAFHAKLSQLLESGGALKIQEALSFLKSCGLLKSGSLIYYSPKMSRGFSATIGEEHSELSSEQWMNWGMMSNGSYLTAQTSECPRTEKGCLLSDILEEHVDEKYFLSEITQKKLLSYRDKKTGTITARTGSANTVRTYVVENKQQTQIRQIIGGSQGNRVYDPNGLSCTLSSQGGGMGAKTGLYAVPVLTPDRAEKRQNGRRFKENGEPMFTLTGQDRHGVLLGKRIRKLTPKECFRLQGFPDEYFERAAAVNSDRQRYKQAGNSVTVNVIYEIARRL